MYCYNLDIPDLLVKNPSFKKSKAIENSTLEFRYFVDDETTWLLSIPLKNGVIDGQIRLSSNGIVQQTCYMENGLLTGEYTWYYHGVVKRIQLWSNIISDYDKRYIINRRERMEMIIEDCVTAKVIYRGEYNEKYYRHGYGCVYNAQDGELSCYGRFENDKLVELYQSFKGGEMIEYAKSDNPFIERHAIYIGDYIESEKEYRFLRHGNGCTIDPMSGIVIKEGIWNHGELTHSLTIVDGLYPHLDQPKAEPAIMEPIAIEPMDQTVSVEIAHEVDLSSSEPSVVNVHFQQGLDHSVITSSIQLQTLPATLEDFTVTSSICNDVNITELVLADYAMLTSIVIGDNCFENVKNCSFLNLPNVVTIQIGKYSFTKIKNYHQLLTSSQNTKTFTLSNCDKLQTLSLNHFSFSDFGLCQLSSIPLSRYSL